MLCICNVIPNAIISPSLVLTCLMLDLRLLSVAKFMYESIYLHTFHRCTVYGYRDVVKIVWWLVNFLFKTRINRSLRFT